MLDDRSRLLTTCTFSECNQVNYGLLSKKKVYALSESPESHKRLDRGHRTQKLGVAGGVTRRDATMTSEVPNAPKRRRREQSRDVIGHLW